ncbi:MAG TPA: penicillin-binding protein 2 [Acidimicrobiia bacterium]|nr:penicillin-binding protein 2 [Acidimicrobiia bacterium]
MIAFLAVSVRLVDLQALSAARYRELGLEQRLRTVPINAERGSIFDRNGRDLAISVQRETIWADPRLVVDPGAAARALAPIVGVDEALLTERLARRDREFVYVARTVDDAIAQQVRALDLPGVSFVYESARQYPGGALAAALLGEVGLENAGLFGLEALYDDELAGKPGELVVERDRDGRTIPRTVRREQQPERGTDLVLTIDQAIQYRVERTLADQVTAESARGGMAVVIDVESGDVLAMATVVGDETGIARPATASERNRPLTDTFEPGSTNKVITVASALDEGLVGPHTEFDLDDWITVGDKQFREDHPHGRVRWSVSEILAQSSNVGTITIAQLLGKERLDAALREFGLDDPTAIDFPGQADGVLLDPDEYYGVGMGSVPIGYALSVSAMQILDVYTTIANGGVTVPPRVVSGRIDAGGGRVTMPVEHGTRVLTEPTAQAVATMLERVVTDGTGTCAAVRGYNVAGKTGTSRKARPEGGYADDRHMATFVGFAPAEAPRLATIVVIDEPAQTYGGRAAAPAFAEIMQHALRSERVQPSAVVPGVPSQWDVAHAAASAERLSCAVPHGTALTELVEARAAAAAAAAAAAEDPAGTLPTVTTEPAG